MAEEAGSWSYLVVDPSGIRPRDEPNYSKDSKNKSIRFKEGTVVEIDARRRAGWTTWLRLTSGEGWLFDVSPKDKSLRLLEVTVMMGEWLYEACADRVPILAKPSALLAAKASRTAEALHDGEKVRIKERIRPVNGKGTYLLLESGQGWVLDYESGRQLMRRVFSPDDAGSPDVATGSAEASHRPEDMEEEEALRNQQPLHLTGPQVAMDKRETGEWNYIILDQKGISLRQSPSYDAGEKVARRVEEGELATVLERIPGDGTTFLRLASPQGWIHDMHPDPTKRFMRAMQVHVERGSWYYQVIADTGIALRSRCSFSEFSRVGKGPLKGAVVEVMERVKVGETTFLRLQESKCWVFDCKNGRRMVDGPLKAMMLHDTSTTVVPQEGVNLMSSPSKGAKWAITKLLLLGGSAVEVSCICEVGDTTWAHVSRPGGGNMEGWVQLDHLALEKPKAAAWESAPGTGVAMGNRLFDRCGNSSPSSRAPINVTPSRVVQ